MKKLFVSIFALLILFSCSSDDGNEPESKNYLPISVGHSWTYDFSTSLGSAQSSGSAVTTMNSTTQVESINYTNWDAVTRVFGFTDNLLVNKTGGITTYRIPEINLGFNQSLSLDPFIIINDNSSPGTILGEAEVNQQFDAFPVNQDGFTGTITPTVSFYATSLHTNSFPTTTLNGGEVYEDVYKNESTFEVKIELVANLQYQGIPINLTHVWVPQQEYAKLEGWYANEIGLVRSEIEVQNLQPDNTVEVPIIGEIDLTDFGIIFDDFVAIDQGTNVAELTDYTL